MTDLRQAAEMALKYFEDAYGLEDTEVTIKEALRQALAQPEHEPVAWGIVENGRVHGLVKSKPAVMNAEKWQPLYTAPPKCEWVGLTDEEYDELMLSGDWGGSLIQATEAKLKEKNA